MNPLSIALYEAGKALGCAEASVTVLSDKAGALHWLDKARRYIDDAERIIRSPKRRAKKGGAS